MRMTPRKYREAMRQELTDEDDDDAFDNMMLRWFKPIQILLIIVVALCVIAIIITISLWIVVLMKSA